MRRSAALVLLMVAVGCDGPSWLPRLTIPQLEQARESVRGGIGRRYEDHVACAERATDARTMVACMDRSGYDYIARSVDPQATECWRILDLNPPDTQPEALCFVRKAEPPR